jgi:hypothetical protein
MYSSYLSNTLFTLVKLIILIFTYLLTLLFKKYGNKYEYCECLTLLIFLRVLEVECFFIFTGTYLQLMNLDFSNSFNSLNSVLCIILIPWIFAIFIAIYFKIKKEKI